MLNTRMGGDQPAAEILHRESSPPPVPESIVSCDRIAAASDMKLRYGALLSTVFLHTILPLLLFLFLFLFPASLSLSLLLSVAKSADAAAIWISSSFLSSSHSSGGADDSMLGRHGFLASLGAFLAAIIAFLALLRHRSLQRRQIYMVDFVCYKPEDDRKVSKQYFLENSGLIGLFTPESIDFQRKILERSGLGHETYFPPAVTRLPPNPCLDEARKEAEVVAFGAMDELFAKTRVSPGDISILVLNCSAFCPAPSLTAAIINRYKLREDVVAYNLAGMGCSAGVISWDLAKRLMWLRPNSYALAFSTENITLNWYRGNEKNLLVSNCLFRMGGAAMLLTNRSAERRRAKYELLHTVRTNKAAEDKGYFCVQQEDDPNGLLGVVLSKELMSVAAGALRTNITSLGPLVLPYSEQLRFAWSFVARRVLRLSPDAKPYAPDFKKAFEHFCIHAGGRAVLDRVEEALQLSERQMEPNRMTLYRFGNTSSSTIYYELAYLEAKGRIKRGDRIWQIGFGSGFKCNSAVWRALRHQPPASVSNCWSSFIHRFPVHIPAVDDFTVSPATAAASVSPATTVSPAAAAAAGDSNEMVDNVVIYA